MTYCFHWISFIYFISYSLFWRPFSFFSLFSFWQDHYHYQHTISIKRWADSFESSTCSHRNYSWISIRIPNIADTSHPCGNRPTHHSPNPLGRISSFLTHSGSHTPLEESRSQTTYALSLTHTHTRAHIPTHMQTVVLKHTRPHPFPVCRG